MFFAVLSGGTWKERVELAINRIVHSEMGYRLPGFDVLLAPKHH